MFIIVIFRFLYVKNLSSNLFKYNHLLKIFSNVYSIKNFVHPKSQQVEVILNTDRLIFNQFLS